MNIFKIYVVSLIIFIPFSVQAFSLDDLFDAFDSFTTSTSQIINKVNVSASTGGNTAEPGQVIQGQSEAKIHIESTVNGETVEPIDIEVQSKDEEAKVKVEQEITYPDEDDQPKVEQKIEINEQVETEEESTEEIIEPSLEITTNQESKPIIKITNKLSQWWSSFLGGLKAKLANIVGFWRK